MSLTLKRLGRLKKNWKVNEHHRHITELKQQFKQDFDKAQSFVNEFDPCRLIYTEAPIDEYYCLTTQLLSAVYNRKTRTEIKDLILHEIEHHFETPDLETLTEPYKTKFITT